MDRAGHPAVSSKRSIRHWAIDVFRRVDSCRCGTGCSKVGLCPAGCCYQGDESDLCGAPDHSDQKCFSVSCVTWFGSVYTQITGSELAQKAAALVTRRAHGGRLPVLLPRAFRNAFDHSYRVVLHGALFYYGIFNTGAGRKSRTLSLACCHRWIRGCCCRDTPGHGKFRHRKHAACDRSCSLCSLPGTRSPSSNSGKCSSYDLLCQRRVSCFRYSVGTGSGVY